MSDNNTIIESDTNALGDIKTKHQFEELSKKIIGAAIEVHKTLGPGFLESTYEAGLKVELSKHKIRYESQKEITIQYVGMDIGVHRLDLIAVKELADIHFAQLRSYLKASGLRAGLLLNFAKPTLEIKRVVN